MNKETQIVWSVDLCTLMWLHLSVYLSICACHYAIIKVDRLPPSGQLLCHLVPLTYSTVCAPYSIRLLLEIFLI